MAQDKNGGSNNAPYFVIGRIVVVVGLLAFLHMGGDLPGQVGR